jgi:glycerophosphoryl diester phosphodiesterase
MPSSARLPTAATLALAVLLAGSCNVRSRVTVPTFPDGGMLRDATPLPGNALVALEARFHVKDGGGRFGPEVATRKSPGRLSIFGDNEAVYSILEGGCLDGGDTLVLEGYWRFATATDTGLLRLFVGPAATARALCAGQAAPKGPDMLTISGVVGDGADLPSEPITFSASGPLVAYAGKFMSISHHGASTTQDYGASENTVESFRLAEAMGADAVEVDVRLTKDGVPILFHDPGLSAVLVQGRFCRGDLADLTFAEISASCRSDRGEPIYSLEEGLLGAIDGTTLRGAWLDIKEAAAVAPALAVVARTHAHALAVDRSFFHVFGLPSQDIADAYVAAKPPSTSECLVEYDESVALATGCIAWGPRFTEGPQPDAVKAAQLAGLAVYFWTVDGVPFIEEYLTVGKPNGMITDTPGLAFYVYQHSAWKPAGGHEPHGGEKNH